MGRRFVRTLLFGGVAILLFDAARQLASEQRPGWGWFVRSE